MQPWGKFSKEISEIEEKATVWRYMDLAKLIDLFLKRRLYFNRCDLFPDSFEGMPTVPMLKYQYARFRGLEEEVPGVFKDPEKSADKTFLELRECNFVNCWYLGGQESAAMWSLYSKDGGGVAIQSTVEDLREAMPHDVCFGKVVYVDHNTHQFGEYDDLRNLFFFKRHHFDHERELRILYSISERDPAKTGHYVRDIDLNKMIQSVVLSPGTPAWSRESIEAIVQSVCPDSKILTSALKNAPPIKFI